HPHFGGNAAEMLWRTARRAPDAPAIRDGGTSLSYARLREAAAAVAGQLVAAGVRPGDRVAIFLDRGARAAAACFGSWGAGAVVVMVNETVRTRQLDYVAGHAGASVLLTSEEMLGRLHRPPEGPARTLLVRDTADPAEPFTGDPVGRG